jgi:peptide/nickel transport system substrate-binding protein
MKRSPANGFTTQLAGSRLSRRSVLKTSAAASGALALGGVQYSLTAAQEGGGIAILASPVDIPNIDPAIGHDGAISVTQKHLYDTLYRHLGADSALVPWLATGHEVSEDATVWTFTLDPNATFKDGSPVTAEAVVYSTQRLIELNQGVAWMFTGILEPENVVAVDDQTVQFTLNQPFAPFLHAVTWIFVLNPAEVAANEVDGDSGQAWLVSNSAGSGPFTIARWEPGNLYEFTADPDYWKGWESPHVDGYIHQISTESSTKRIALQSGEIQFADWLSPQDKMVLSSQAGVVVPMDPSISTYTLKLNNQVGPTADVNVRRAISWAMDYDALIEVMNGFGTRIAGPLSPALTGAVQEPVYQTDIEKAKEELAKSEEWADGFDIDFVYVTGLEEERQTGLILADQLSQLNINVNVVGMEWANAVALFADPETSPAIFPIYSGSDYPDADNFLWQSFHSSSAGTWTGASHYSNPEVDALLEEGRTTTDEAARIEIYTQVQEIVIDEAVEVYLTTPIEGLPHREEVTGYVYTPVMGSSPWFYETSLA